MAMRVARVAPAAPLRCGVLTQMLTLTRMRHHRETDADSHATPPGTDLLLLQELLLLRGRLLLRRHQIALQLSFALECVPVGIETAQHRSTWGDLTVAGGPRRGDPVRTICRRHAGRHAICVFRIPPPCIASQPQADGTRSGSGQKGHASGSACSMTPGRGPHRSWRRRCPPLTPRRTATDRVEGVDGRRASERQRRGQREARTRDTEDTLSKQGLL